MHADTKFCRAVFGVRAAGRLKAVVNGLTIRQTVCRASALRLPSAFHKTSISGTATARRPPQFEM